MREVLGPLEMLEREQRQLEEYYQERRRELEGRWVKLARELVMGKVCGDCYYRIAPLRRDGAFGYCYRWYGHPKPRSDAESMRSGGGGRMAKKDGQACENWLGKV